MIDIKQLKRTRLRLGLTQSTLAKYAGLSQSLITKIEANKIDPKYSTVKRLEETLSHLENKDQPTVATVLQKNVISTSLDEKIPHLIKRMQKANISQVPVMEGKHVAGLLTESIILEAIGAEKNLGELTAQDLMTEAPPSIPATTPLSTTIRLLEHVPLIIVKEKNNIAGIVTKSDLLKAQL